MDTYKNLFSALSHHSEHSPSRRVYSFVDGKGQLQQALTWEELRLQIDALTGFLRRHCRLQLGDRVLLVYPPSLDFVVAFAACIRAGLIPVPVYPPNPMQADKGMAAFNGIAANCDARLVLTNRSYARKRKLSSVQGFLTRSRANRGPDLSWVTTDDVQVGDYAPFHGPEARPDDVAFIQYTSGSTSSPKGVVVTHGNLSHQLGITHNALQADGTARGVLWVPQYHDMGLVGGILNALGGNVELTLFSPLDFIKRPALWFELMHELRATHTAAPNFAYELSLRKTTAEQRAKWDLSSLQVVMSGAEPVRAHTSRRFLEAFAVSGLKPEAYRPAYGLAEHTVAVSFNGGNFCRVDKDQLETQREVRVCDTQEANTVELVSSGTLSDDIHLKIVDPEASTPCAENEVGEIWVDSPSKAAGYWNMRQESVRSFSARLEGDENHRYLRTGDLGFVQGGQLYICGRIKDMLILAGRNLYPQDVEDCIQHIDEALKPGGVAAFAADVQAENRTEEKLVLLAEVRSGRYTKTELRSLAEALQRAVLESQQTACHSIVLAPAGTVLKTTSGKVRRQACRAMWVDGTLANKALFVLESKAPASSLRHRLEPVASPESGVCNEGPRITEPANEREAVMQRIAAQLMNLPSPKAVDLLTPLTQQGMGSLIAVEFCQEYESETHEELSIAQFFNHPSIRALNRSMEAGSNTAETLDALHREATSSVTEALRDLRDSSLHHRDAARGFRIGRWAVRPARLDDGAEIHRLDQQEYGWLGEEATDDAEFIKEQLLMLNSGKTPWLWLLEKGSAPDKMEVVGWYIMQPTNQSPSAITSWADATDHGRLTSTFDAAGKHLYLVAAGVAREHSKQAHRLMVLNALSLMKAENISSVFACLAMPGFAEAHASQGIAAEEYVGLEHENGMPRDAFLAFFRELWEGEHRPFRLLRDGYPPDQLSGGHGVCACVDLPDYDSAIKRVFDKLVQQRAELFDDWSAYPETDTPRDTAGTPALASWVPGNVASSPNDLLPLTESP